jgi:type I restriction enzyme S subunit
MGAEWKRVTVDEVCDLIVDCVNKTAPIVEEVTPYKMLRTTNIKGGRIDRENCRRVTKDTYQKWTRRAEIRRGDVILTREAPVGEVGYVDFDDTVFLGQRLMQYRANPALLEPRFLHYTFLSKDLQNQFAAHDGSGSTVSHIRVGDCSKFQLNLPPLSEQKAIARILGTLDDKIELNRRMNATLEAMARALFQSWFVDFDPVHAKAAARPPSGMDEQTAALFPDSFHDSEAGHIPKGWGYVSLEALASIRGGKQLPTEGCLPVGKFTVFGANGIMGYATESTHNGFVIAFGRVGAYCGSIHWSLDSAWINNNASAVVPLMWPAFVLQTMLNVDFHSMRTGSAQPFIPNSSLASAKVLRPSPQIAEAFCRIVEPLRRLQADNDKQSRTLATLRDTLLPKLLSGTLGPVST